MRELASCREVIDIILAWCGKGLDTGVCVMAMLLV